MVLIYARTSSDDDKNNTPIQQQIEAGKKFASLKNDSFIIYADEAISGSSDDLTKRPQMIILLEKIKEKNHIVWCWEQSRISRNSYTSAIIFREFKKNGVNLYIQNKLIDLNNPTDKFTTDIFSALADYEKQLIFARTKRGKDALIDTGWKSCNNLYGYTKGQRDAKTGRWIWEQKESEMAELKLFFYNLSNGKSMHKILAELYPNATSTERFKLISIWGRRVKILEYTGKTKNKSGDLIPCINFPVELVSVANWEKIQIDIDSRNSLRNRKSSELATGLIKCGKCDKKYYHIPVIERRNKNEEKVYQYYKHYYRTSTENVCGQKPKYLDKHMIDEIFNFVYLSSLKNKIDLEIIKIDLAEKKENELKNKSYLLDLIDLQIVEAKKKLERIKKAIIAGLNEDDFIDEFTALKNEILSLENRKKDNKGNIKILDDNLNTITNTYTLSEVRNWENLETIEKREKLSKFCTASIIDNILTIYTIKTNRNHIFNLDHLNVDKLSILPTKMIEQMATLTKYNLNSKSVFNFTNLTTTTLLDTTLLPTGKTYDYSKVDF